MHFWNLRTPPCLRPHNLRTGPVVLLFSALFVSYRELDYWEPLDSTLEWLGEAEQPRKHKKS